MKKIQRPIRIYFWTAVMFLQFGILKFVEYYSVIRESNGEIPLPTAVVSLGLCAFTAAAAIWAFIGDNEGRIALILFVALNLLWSLYLGTMALSDDVVENDRSAITEIIYLVYVVLSVVGFFWYFVSEEAVDYYKQNERT